MPEAKVNRRDLIVNTASKFFIEQGYDATSVRQIAEAVGCTEAALYYHFKDGKRELLQAVVECNMPDLMSVLDHCRDAQSLYELIKQYGQEMAKLAPLRLNRMRWLVAEFPSFSEGERSLFHFKHLHFHNGLAALIEPFVDTPQEADELAWIVGCVTFGYGQLFMNLDIRSVTDFHVDTLMERLARSLAAGR